MMTIFLNASVGVNNFKKSSIAHPPSEVDPDRETAGAVFLGVARPISVPAPIAPSATVMASLLLPLVDINPLVVVPVGMWAKASPRPGCRRSRSAKPIVHISTGILLRRSGAACDSPGSGAGAPRYRSSSQEPMPALASATLA